MNKIKKGIYKHSKSGKEYKVHGLAKHSETLEDVVVYEALYDNEVSKFWVRPFEMFTDEVEIEGAKVSRFEFAREE